MEYWKWSNLRVVEDWEEGKSEAQRLQVYRALFDVLDNDEATIPGEPLQSSGSTARRLIRTPSAVIYFMTHEAFGNAAHGTLFLTGIVDATDL